MQYPHTPIRCRGMQKECIAYNHTRDERHSFAPLFWENCQIFFEEPRKNTSYMSATLRLHHKYSNKFSKAQKIRFLILI